MKKFCWFFSTLKGGVQIEISSEEKEVLKGYFKTTNDYISLLDTKLQEKFLNKEGDQLNLKSIVLLY